MRSSLDLVSLLAVKESVSLFVVDLKCEKVWIICKRYTCKRFLPLFLYIKYPPCPLVQSDCKKNFGHRERTPENMD